MKCPIYDIVIYEMFQRHYLNNNNKISVFLGISDMWFAFSDYCLKNYICKIRLTSEIKN